MPKKRSKPKEPERVEIIEAAREESDDEEAPQPQELPAEAEHAEFLKVTVTPNPNCLFVAGTKFESEGDPTRTCNSEHDHVSCGRCPYPG